MRVFALSDVHIDYAVNRKWLSNLSSFDYQCDVLILAGDLTDKLDLLQRSFQDLVSKFRKVLFVPGNHELWVTRDDSQSSLSKFHNIIELAKSHGIATELYHHNTLSIVPLFSWYDFSFGLPNDQLRESWTDFRACKWPLGHDIGDISHYFLDKNTSKLRETNETVISFSHFLPRIDVMPSFIPEKQRYLYPVLGSVSLGEQVKALKPNIHIYGHSHVNNQVDLDGVRYINNAFGYPTEKRIAKKRLLCIYEN